MSDHGSTDHGPGAAGDDGDALLLPDDLGAALERDLGPGPLPEDERFMALALREAARAYEEGEVPVGAVVIGAGGRLLGKAHNQREVLCDPTAHAEMIALTQAATALESWRLSEATLYVTLEPCPMCAGALVNARLGRLVFGAWDPKAGACGSLFDIVRDRRLNHRVPTTGGVLAKACGEILKAFFRERRGAANGPAEPGA